MLHDWEPNCADRLAGIAFRLAVRRGGGEQRAGQSAQLGWSQGSKTWPHTSALGAAQSRREALA